MQSRILLFLLILIFIYSCSEQSTKPDPKDNSDILIKLQSLPGVDVREIEPNWDYPREFEIDITQPIDHNNPDGPSFTQRLYILHESENNPVVFLPSGYQVSERSYSALAYLTGANQIAVTHRFMPGSKPDGMDYQFLDIRQAAEDHHQIVDLFKSIYDGPWISYGGSKGGLAALYHRRFYPEDVEATVALVAPIMFGTEDSRFDKFLLEDVADEDCRNRLKQFQRQVLQNKQEIIPLVIDYLSQRGEPYSWDIELILEIGILEYFFYFWQYGDGDCNSIPDSNATSSEMFTHLTDNIWFEDYTDPSIDWAEPVYYQIYNEMGYYRLITDHLQDLLTSLEYYSHRVFLPVNVDVAYKPEVTQDINNWLQSEGNNIIYIYGSQDPYTSCAIELTGQTNALKIVQSGANHRIYLWDLDDAELVYSTLEEWTGIEINRMAKQGIPFNKEATRSKPLFYLSLDKK